MDQDKINLLRHNARQVVRELGLLNEAYFDIGVTLAERHLLIELSTSSCPTMGEIAQKLLLDKSTASRLIARATKKGYIQSTLDKQDKRKRYLSLTELGRQTLQSFETIAFQQTKGALDTLSPGEIETVHQGVALYAKGLRNSRLQGGVNKKEEKNPPFKIALSIPGLTLSPFQQSDEPALAEIFKQVVD